MLLDKIKPTQNHNPSLNTMLSHRVISLLPKG